MISIKLLCPGTCLLNVLSLAKNLQRSPIRWTCGLWVSSFFSVCMEGRWGKQCKFYPWMFFRSLESFLTTAPTSSSAFWPQSVPTGHPAREHHTESHGCSVPCQACFQQWGKGRGTCFRKGHCHFKMSHELSTKSFLSFFKTSNWRAHFWRPPPLGLHQAVLGIQEGGPDRRSPDGKRPVPAPSHAKVKLLWKSADKRGGSGTGLLQHRFILTGSYRGDEKATRLSSHTRTAPPRLRPVGEGTSRRQEEQDTGGEISPGLLGRAPGFYLFTGARSVEGQWGHGFKRTWVKGSFEGLTKALILATYHEENVTGFSVQMLLMERAEGTLRLR